MTKRKVTITISVLWALSAVTSVGYLLIGDMNREVVSIVFTITFLVTTTITAQERTLGQNCNDLTLTKRKFKSAMNIFYVYAAFAACFLPYTCTKLAIATTGHNLVLKGVFHCA